MRYLNKVIFIESANIRYSEVSLDGNVHLTGTQGVGKSTLLRALLFFYNANQQKLGIPIEKKRFIEFYFPYQNSFIIYEVMHENGAFCVLAYKSQGRVVFRFFNSEYKRNFFISEADGRIAESWDIVRDNLSRDRVKYTRLIDRYEEYRNIIYGNNKSLGSEFRKYTLLESRKYQNIPRAIQHVFLNYKVESDFIKDTIIKSLDEDEMQIILANYTLHLKDFETQLNDIKIWTEKSAKGENRIRKLADKIVETYSQIRFTEQDFSRLSATLMSKLTENEQLRIKSEAKLTRENDKENSIVEKQKKLQKEYDDRKTKIAGEKGVFVNKIKEAKLKSEEYQHRNIEEVLLRISKKSDLTQDQQNLSAQKTLLESNFNDIRQKYEIQIEQLNNQYESYKNSQQEKSQKLDAEFFRFKEKLFTEHEEAVFSIRKQFDEKYLQAKSKIDDKKDELSKLRNKLFEAKHTKYHEAEIESCTKQIRSDNEKTQQANLEISRIENENATLKRQWELEKQRLEEVSENEKNANQKTIQQLSENIVSICTRIENSKDSLYGWLNNEYPNWEKTIGKVVDEDSVLFKAGLSPQKANSASDNFYGIKINLDEIEKKIKTIPDYEAEIADIEKKIEAVKRQNSEVEKRLNEQTDVLKKKYHPRLKKNKDAVERCNYDIAQYKLSSDKANVELGNRQRKAEDDKINRIEEINQQTDKATVEKVAAENELAEIDASITKKIKTKQKERDSKNEVKQKLLNTEKQKISQVTTDKKHETDRSIQTLKENQSKELKDQGADMEKISSLEKQLDEIAAELKYIDDNAELAFNYKKDENELFSKVDYFKTKRDLLEIKLKEEESKQEVKQQKLKIEFDEVHANIGRLNKEITAIEDDTNKFAEFQKSEIYTEYQPLFQRANKGLTIEKSGIAIIEELTAKYYSRMKLFDAMKENINKFNGNFNEQNIFKFNTRLVENAEYRQFAEDLKEFIEEDKIDEYEKRVSELFARIIQQVGNETEQLLSKESAIRKVINDINADFVKKDFAGVIKSIELRMVPSSNKIVQLLGEIKVFNDENIYNFGEVNLFTTNLQNQEENNKKAVQYLSSLSKAISEYKNDIISLSDSFELEFKVVENDNDTGWVDKLANVGSDGTDVLVKAMINIMLLNVFKEGATKNQFKEFRLHCMMDEIGKLHPNNVRGILKFANDRNIFLVNGSPQSFDALAYKYTYKLSKRTDKQIGKEVTIIQRIITNNRT